MKHVDMMTNIIFNQYPLIASLIGYNTQPESKLFVTILYSGLHSNLGPDSI